MSWIIFEPEVNCFTFLFFQRSLFEEYYDRTLVLNKKNGIKRNQNPKVSENNNNIHTKSLKFGKSWTEIMTKKIFGIFQLVLNLLSFLGGCKGCS